MKELGALFCAHTVQSFRMVTSANPLHAHGHSVRLTYGVTSQIPTPGCLCMTFAIQPALPSA